MKLFAIHCLTLFAIVLNLPTVVADEISAEVRAIIESQAAANKGKALYLINCQQCHDADGRALANIDVVAADLTNPSAWAYGTEPINIFNNIKQGAGLSMPAFKDTLSDSDIWHIVAHILNIGPPATRPPNP